MAAPCGLSKSSVFFIGWKFHYVSLWGMDIGHLKTNSMNRNLRAFERDVDCGIGYIGVEKKIIPSKL